MSASLCAQKIRASAIVSITRTGTSAQFISRFRPRTRLIALTENESTLNKMELVWGIQALPVQNFTSTDEMMELVSKILVQYGLCKTGDRLVFTLGLPLQENVKTNALRVHTVACDDVVPLSSEKLPLRCVSF